MKQVKNPLLSGLLYPGLQVSYFVRCQGGMKRGFQGLSRGRKRGEEEGKAYHVNKEGWKGELLMGS